MSSLLLLRWRSLRCRKKVLSSTTANPLYRSQTRSFGRRSTQSDKRKKVKEEKYLHSIHKGQLKDGLLTGSASPARACPPSAGPLSCAPGPCTPAPPRASAGPSAATSPLLWLSCAGPKDKEEGHGRGFLLYAVNSSTSSLISTVSKRVVDLQPRSLTNPCRFIHKSSDRGRLKKLDRCAHLERSDLKRSGQGRWSTCQNGLTSRP
jgi:hypothetical protein